MEACGDERREGVRADGVLRMVETSSLAKAARADAERKHAATSGVEARVRMVEASSAA